MRNLGSLGGGKGGGGGGGMTKEMLENRYPMYFRLGHKNTSRGGSLCFQLVKLT
jgi:hypothetical protein